MSFTSPSFMFVILPLVLAGYYLIRVEYRYIFLFAASLLFYYYCQSKAIYILLISIAVNYALGIVIERYLEKRKLISRLSLAISLIFNVMLLFVFKYLNFGIKTFNELFSGNIQAVDLILPIGISFFVFKSISYVADVYKGKVSAEKNIIRLALYISFFVEIMAGPISRYSDISRSMTYKKIYQEDIINGIARFITGLSKKLILSNTFAIIADRAYGMETEGVLTVCMAWAGAVGYTLQIYFDFSGYSDMAIGIGKMLGYDIKENFDYPYISASVSEFWRRWHISLGSWFRDYVYIPLGGNRVGRFRLYINLFAVWFLTGVWHGANWTFIVWGLMYFVLLTFEKTFKIPERIKSVVLKALYRVFTLIAVTVGWVIFRADSIGQAENMVFTMFGAGGKAAFSSDFSIYILKNYALFLILGFVLSTPVIKILNEKLKDNIIYRIFAGAVLLALFLICISYSVGSSYNPFIYFDF